VKVAIVGCGAIGRKRLDALGPNHRLVIAADTNAARARVLADRCSGAESASDWRRATDHPDVDIVIVCTTHDFLTPISRAAVAAGKHVLVEKPAARSVEEIDPLIEESEDRGVRVHVGLNHRFHPAFRKAREIFESGILGELMFIRGRYGHGGRPGYNREWRADPKVSGGGELLDQGVHLIDLSRWFLGDFVGVEGFTHTYFWDMPVEDNGFMMLRTATNQMAWLHVSWSEWKNLFSFEICGRDGKLQVDGLGGSYGTERLTHYRMLPEMGPPQTTAWEYPGPDRSFELEFEAFTRAIAGGGPSTGLRDARAALDVVGRIYRSSAS
jgi:predicted dehydrogenase